MRLLSLLLLTVSATAAQPLPFDPGPKPAPVTPEQRPLLGHYGSGGTEVIVFERGGRLLASVEGSTFALLRVAEHRFHAPDAPSWLGDTLTFSEEGGIATRFVVEGRTFVRRGVGGEEGDVFRIVPQRPVEEIRAAALRATPPPSGSSRTGDLVELVEVVPNLKLDVRYATERNFMGAAFYTQARAFLQRPAALALVRVQRDLEAHGLGLLIYDAYRPWYVTKAFWDATPEALRGYVANPANGSRHNRGCAVDLGLYSLETGEPVDMPSDYDEFTPRASPDYPGGTSLARWHRDVLRTAMTRHGFTVNPGEWWHFDYRSWREYPILNVPFETL